jgi:hypothetical protein
MDLSVQSLSKRRHSVNGVKGWNRVGDKKQKVFHFRRFLEIIKVYCWIYILYIYSA